MLDEGGLLHGMSVGHLRPNLERDIACGTMLVSDQAMTTELEVVVDAGVTGQEALRMPR